MAVNSPEAVDVENPILNGCALTNLANSVSGPKNDHGGGLKSAMARCSVKCAWKCHDTSWSTQHIGSTQEKRREC